MLRKSAPHEKPRHSGASDVGPSLRLVRPASAEVPILINLSDPNFLGSTCGTLRASSQACRSLHFATYLHCSSFAPGTTATSIHVHSCPMEPVSEKVRFRASHHLQES